MVFPATSAPTGLVQLGSESHLLQMCIKNTFIHLQERPLCPQRRSSSCPAQIASLLKPPKANDGPFDAQVSTVMLKNIPPRCSQGEVLSCMCDHGFQDKYDMFHMPKRPNHTNFGFAFVHFV